ncbi:putative zinc-binding peptidase [Algoriphagus sp.]|uniref:zinc-binding metallopeptidase family protein n=1 Tax=Algoriphagus sp. TaxID=1872435 RepID=UPI003297D9AE
MKLFECGNCSHTLFFENLSCEKCGHLTGYDHLSAEMLTFQPNTHPLVSDRKGIAYKYCQNREFGVCNWLIPAEDNREFCPACELNRTIPNLSDSENFSKWQKLEVAKHRLVYQLLALRLEILPQETNPEIGLCFDFIARQGDSKIMTGHANGVVTILLSEADSVHREQMRKQLSEPYRTLIGHFRHEVGHYFWDRLINRDQKVLGDFRAIFGNEQADYAASLKTYYQNGAPENWQDSCISQYATSHPWEDWAETWAHYLHIMDMTETAYYFGIAVRPKVKNMALGGSADFDPYTVQDFLTIYNAWAPISFSINSLNRSMGIPDAYPFVVSHAVVEKMKFIHHLVCRQ